jgi:hypothetical protein
MPSGPIRPLPWYHAIATVFVAVAVTLTYALVGHRSVIEAVVGGVFVAAAVLLASAWSRRKRAFAPVARSALGAA